MNNAKPISLYLGEEDRQMILLAIAELALSRGGWDDALRRIAKKLRGEDLFDGFKAANGDRVKASHKDL